MKFKTHMAMVLALTIALLVPQAIQARQLPTKNAAPTPECLNALKWQRWNYTKAHINVIQSLKQYNPKPVAWSNANSSERICRTRLASAKKLRLAEVGAWHKLRLQPSGVKWIIRHQFWKSGRDIVRNALRVASCESNFLPNAYNGADTGVWQINYVHHVPDHIMRSPELSTAWAWRASDGGRNFSPTWVCAILRDIP